MNITQRTALVLSVGLLAGGGAVTVAPVVSATSAPTK